MLLDDAVLNSDSMLLFGFLLMSWLNGMHIKWKRRALLSGDEVLLLKMSL